MFLRFPRTISETLRSTVITRNQLRDKGRGGRLPERNCLLPLFAQKKSREKKNRGKRGGSEERERPALLIIQSSCERPQNDTVD